MLATPPPLPPPPRSLRALYGTDGTQNATHGSDSPASAAREIKFFFPLQRTFALIKPDAVHAGKDREIMKLIVNAGFVIVAQETLQVGGWVGPCPLGGWVGGWVCRLFMRSLCRAGSPQAEPRGSSKHRLGPTPAATYLRTLDSGAPPPHHHTHTNWAVCT